MITKENIGALARELDGYLHHSLIKEIDFEIGYNEEIGQIFILPTENSVTHHVNCVLDAVLFAEYHHLNISTEPFDTGAGLIIF